MQKLSVNKRIGTLILSGFVMVGSFTGCMKSEAKSLSTGELKTTPIEDLLEDEDIRNITVLDEEIANGNLDIIEKDNMFRKKVMELEYYASAGDKEGYNETLNWLRNNFEDTSVTILLTAAKGGIADEENKSTSDITLTPAPDFDEDRLLKSSGVAEVKNSDGFSSAGYTIKADLINEAIEEAARIQTNNYNEYTVKDLLREYDGVTKTAKMAIATGASRHDDKIVEKNSEKYIKKNFGINK